MENEVLDVEKVLEEVGEDVKEVEGVEVMPHLGGLLSPFMRATSSPWVEGGR